MSTSSMADELDLESKSVQLLYPTYPNAYKILEEIGGGGAGATIHKAICVHNQWKSSLVTIKIIDLEQSPADLVRSNDCLCSSKKSCIKCKAKLLLFFLDSGKKKILYCFITELKCSFHVPFSVAYIHKKVVYFCISSHPFSSHLFK